MNKPKITRSGARILFDMLRVEVSSEELAELHEWRIALVNTPYGYSYRWQNLPTPDFVGWVGVLHMLMFYDKNCKRLPIGTSVDTIYRFINHTSKRKEQPKRPLRTDDRGTTEEDHFMDTIYNVSRTIPGHGTVKARRIILRMQNEGKFKGSWKQMGKVIIFKSLVSGRIYKVEID